jgi:hypothetical protein
MVLDSCARARARVKAVLAGAGGGEERRAKSEDEAKRGRGRRRRWSVREWAKQSTKRRARAKSRSVGEAGMVVVPSAGARRRSRSRRPSCSRCPCTTPRAPRGTWPPLESALLPRALRSRRGASASSCSLGSSTERVSPSLFRSLMDSTKPIEHTSFVDCDPALCPCAKDIGMSAASHGRARYASRRARVSAPSDASYLLSRCLEGHR